VVSSGFVETYQSDRLPIPTKVFFEPTLPPFGVAAPGRESDIRSDTRWIPDSNPEAGSFCLFLFWSLAIPRQLTRTRNIMQASVRRTTDNRVRLGRERYSQANARRAIVSLEYDCLYVVDPSIRLVSMHSSIDQ
jgi:hypothetical protein